MKKLVNHNGGVIIPKEIRDELGIMSGDEVNVELTRGVGGKIITVEKVEKWDKVLKEIIHKNEVVSLAIDLAVMFVVEDKIITISYYIESNSVDIALKMDLINFLGKNHPTVNFNRFSNRHRFLSGGIVLEFSRYVKYKNYQGYVVIASNTKVDNNRYSEVEVGYKVELADKMIKKLYDIS